MKKHRGRGKNSGGKKAYNPKGNKYPSDNSIQVLPFLVSPSLPDLQGGFVTKAEAGMAHNKQQLLRDRSHGMQELFTWHHKHCSVCLQKFLQKQKVLHSAESGSLTPRNVWGFCFPTAQPFPASCRTPVLRLLFDSFPGQGDRTCDSS